MLLLFLELRSGLDVDKPNVYIDDCISKMEPIHKVCKACNELLVRFDKKSASLFKEKILYLAEKP